jgi:hypothetical protein
MLDLQHLGHPGHPFSRSAFGTLRISRPKAMFSATFMFG